MYRLKDNVDFRFVNKKSIMKYDFDLSNYYEEKTRLFKSPETYIPFSVMCEVFVDFLIPLDLVEEVKNEKDIEELANVIEENIGYNGQELFKTERKPNIDEIVNKINELIKAVNKLKKEGK